MRAEDWHITRGLTPVGSPDVNRLCPLILCPVSPDRTGDALALPRCGNPGGGPPQRGRPVGGRAPQGLRDARRCRGRLARTAARLPPPPARRTGAPATRPGPP